MNKIYLLLLTLLIVSAIASLLFFSIKRQKNSVDSLKVLPILSPEPTNMVQKKENNFLFVPYWSLFNFNNKIENEKYDIFIYFGVSANESGIDKNDLGYKSVGKFIKSTNGKKLLAIRMTDSKLNSFVLEGQNLQKKIIGQSIEITKENSFDGLVLDFEISSLSFESVIKKINSFFEEFYKSAKNNNLIFDIAIYGDTFYRLRPYDVGSLAKNADEVLIMAYDFHKANGDPGPNFPLYGKEIYGYDLTKMASDFLKVVPKEKLGVVFGLFGYDWILDEKNESTTSAEALSFLKIKDIFLDKCNFADCLIKQDQSSSETKITYKDENSQNHIVWFEDMKSVQNKKKYLKSKGINTFAFWAYSYF